MLWKRNDRELRRQLVLDEMLGLPHEEREARFDAAVLTGDVKPEEKEVALKLVGRLEAISFMTIPGIRHRVDVEPAQLAAETSEPPEPPEPLAIAIYVPEGAAEIPVALPVAAQAPISTSRRRVDISPVLAMLGELPLDALESAERLSTRHRRRVVPAAKTRPVKPH